MEISEGPNKLFTIGFTKTTASGFFERIIKNKVKRIIDVRLNNESQLAGFAKKEDLKYFLKKICACDYEHLPILAPTEDILKDYQKKVISWKEYEIKFLDLIKKRNAVDKIEIEKFENACLLCSEDTATCCHRRVVAEQIKNKYQSFEIIHL